MYQIMSHKFFVNFCESISLSSGVTFMQPNMLVVDIEKLVTKMMWPDPRPQKSKANSNGSNPPISFKSIF